tara:strand:- start:1395 stop:1913 length:519 start_codon:yes stop_codon:yes gene_type:complete
MLRKSIFFVAFLALLGCATPLHPGTGMKVSLNLIGPFSGKYSVELTNDQPDKTPHKLFRHFTGDLNEWTQFLIGELSEEFEIRGVEVSPTSPNKFKVRVVELKSAESFAAIRMFITVLLSTADNSWSKKIEVNESSNWSAGRALGGVIYRANEKILKDQEIINRMRLQWSKP